MKRLFAMVLTLSLAGVLLVGVPFVVVRPAEAVARDDAKQPKIDAPSVKLPAEVRADVGMVLIAADTDCAEVQWVVIEGTLQVVPTDLLRNSKTAILIAVKPTRARLMAIVAKGDKPAYAVTTVIVGDAPPVPPIPPPTDPFVKALQTAYDAHLDADKPTTKANLVRIYQRAALIAATEPTWASLESSLRTQATELKVAGKLLQVQTTIADEVKKVRPTNLETPFDAASRKQAADVFGRIAAALEGVR